MSGQSQMLSFAIVTTMGDKILSVNQLSEQRFMFTIMGYWPSHANPNHLNLLAENNVDSCYLITNYANKIDNYYAKPFHDLWRVRYKEHPIKYDLGQGWSQKYYIPSPIQSVYLKKNYKVGDIKTQYFYGESMYELLRNVQDTNWVDIYKNLTAEE